jgi:hypothetical protein
MEVKMEVENQGSPDSERNGVGDVSKGEIKEEMEEES